MTKITAQTTWLVETLDADTNQRISEFLGESLGNEDLRVCKEPNGTEHKLWELPDYAHLQTLIRNAKTFNLRFKTFERHTQNGFVYLAPSWAQPARKKKINKQKLVAAGRLRS